MKYLQVEPCENEYCENGAVELDDGNDYAPCETCDGKGFVPIGDPVTKAKLLEEWGEKMWAVYRPDGVIISICESASAAYSTTAKLNIGAHGYTCSPVTVTPHEPHR